MWLSVLIFFVVAVVLLRIIFWIRNIQNYFVNRKIPYVKSPPLLGAYSDVILGKDGIYTRIEKLYNHPEVKDEKYFGIFVFHKPTLFIKDLEIIKQVLISDFNSFNDRYASSGPHDPPGYYQLFLLKNPMWKTIRSKLTPFFSSAKLKAAFYLIEKLGQKFNIHIEKKFEKGKSRAQIDIKANTDLFFVDVISSIAFGVDAHTMENSGSEFHKAATKIASTKEIHRSFEFLSVILLPQILKYFRFTMFSHFTTKFIYKVMPHVIEERIKSGAKRNDLIDTLLEIKPDLVPEHEGHTVEDIMYGQIGAFLFAGYETSSTTTTFTLYELSKNQELQSRLRNEIRGALVKNDERITYEMATSISEMPLLSQTISETLRFYAILPGLDRICTNPHGVSIDDGSFVIPKGMPILIPMSALFRDPEYFENPQRYDTDRFSSENIHKIPPILANFGFGAGPRFCIGERLALIQTKLAILMLLKDFRVEANEKTPESITYSKKAMIIQSDKDLIVDFVKDPLV